MQSSTTSSNKTVKRQQQRAGGRRKTNKKTVVTRRGRWELHEKKAFLRGLLQFGKGNWKAIAQLIPNR